MDRAGVQGCKPDALDRAGVAEVFQHLVDKELAFPVRVARVDDRSGLTEQLFDYLELSMGAFLGLEPPLTGNHGQGASAPQLPCVIIIIGIILFQQMPEAPGHGVVPTDRIPLTSLRDAEFSGNGFAERWLFSDEETHGLPRSFG